jgi:hypothetical protein
MDLLKSQLTLTKEETTGLLVADYFGLIVWDTTMRTERDAMSFAVHTELININNPTMGVYHGCLLQGVYHECLPLSPFSLLQPHILILSLVI